MTDLEQLQKELREEREERERQYAALASQTGGGDRRTPSQVMRDGYAASEAEREAAAAEAGGDDD